MPRNVSGSGKVFSFKEKKKKILNEMSLNEMEGLKAGETVYVYDFYLNAYHTCQIGMHELINGTEIYFYAPRIDKAIIKKLLPGKTIDQEFLNNSHIFESWKEVYIHLETKQYFFG